MMDYKNFSTEDFIKDRFFIRWIKGDPDTMWFWNSFMKEHPEKVADIEKAKQTITSFSFRKDELSDSEKASMRNKLIMTVQASREEEKEKYSINRTTTGKIWLVAAAVFVMSVCTFLFYTRVVTKESDLKSDGVTLVEERINPKGQKSILQLPDGTKIWLNADSKLTYGKDFGESTRDVYLEGEAFFEVAHNISKPFIVHTSELNIKVLGTSFNVKSYQGDKKIETTLVEGKVRINKTNEPDDAQSRFLIPNQKAVYEKQTKAMNIENIEHAQAERSIAWREDRLVFDETTYEEVIRQLERWYNVKIHVEGKGNLQCKLTASIEKESLEEVLNLLVTSHKISYSIKKDEIFVNGTLCQ
jgi:transmembrane sensor